MRGYTRRKRVEHTFNNQKFKSGDEVRAAEQLQANRDLILYFEYEPKHEDLVWIPKPKKYIPDFKIERADGSILYLEIKGSRFWPGDVEQYSRLKEQYPDMDLRFVWTNGKRKYAKGSNTTCLEWCQKKGFPVSDKGIIPEEWLLTEGEEANGSSND